MNSVNLAFAVQKSDYPFPQYISCLLSLLLSFVCASCTCSILLVLLVNIGLIRLLEHKRGMRNDQS